MVTFGRHPFVRLVSTYKDKVIDGLHPSYRKMMNYDENQPYSVKYFFTFQLSVPLSPQTKAMKGLLLFLADLASFLLASAAHSVSRGSSTMSATSSRSWAVTLVVGCDQPWVTCSLVSREEILSVREASHLSPWPLVSMMLSDQPLLLLLLPGSSLMFSCLLLDRLWILILVWSGTRSQGLLDSVKVTALSTLLLLLMLSTNVAEFTENLWARPPTSPAGRVAKLGRADT